MCAFCPLICQPDFAIASDLSFGTDELMLLLLLLQKSYMRSRVAISQVQELIECYRIACVCGMSALTWRLRMPDT